MHVVKIAYMNIPQKGASISGYTSPLPTLISLPGHTVSPWQFPIMTISKFKVRQLSPVENVELADWKLCRRYRWDGDYRRGSCLGELQQWDCQGGAGKSCPGTERIKRAKLDLSWERMKAKCNIHPLNGESFQMLHLYKFGVLFNTVSEDEKTLLIPL